jgi:CheY-like chemotaxis protein
LFHQRARRLSRSWVVTVSDGSEIARRRILIVEDEPLIAWALADMARELGHEVLGPVGTENAAVEETARLSPDVILMDFRLAGGGSGLAAARRIRETRDVPIIFCTAYAEEPGMRAEMLAVPRALLLGKPIFRASLQRSLAQLVK